MEVTYKDVTAMTIKRLHFIPLTLLLALLGSCSKETPPPVSPADGRTIPYRAMVTEGSGTRAGVDGNMHYLFETGDRLFLTTSSNIGDDKMYGVLSLVSGAGETSAVFEGDLHCTGDFEPAGNQTLYATLVGTADRIHTESDGLITAIAYPTDEYAPDFGEAIRRFSHFTGTGTFSGKTFSLTQQSAFLIFDLTFDESGETVTATFRNGQDPLRSVSLSPVTENGLAHTRFVLPFPGGEASLSSATISIENNLIFNIPGETALAANNYYNIRRSTIPFVTLPPTTDYAAGTAESPSQAFPVRVALPPDANITKNELPSSDLNLIITTPEDGDITIPLTGLDRANGMDLTPADVLSAILTKEGTDVLKTGDYIFSINGVESSCVSMRLIESAFTSDPTPSTGGWGETIGPLGENDYVEAKMMTRNDKNKANLIGFGKIINSWSNGNAVLFYYPCDNATQSKLRMQARTNQTISQKDTQVSPGSVVIRFDWTGVYVNGEDYSGTTKLDSELPFYKNLLIDAELKVGSREGSVLSNAYYDYVRVVKYPAN